MALRPLLFACVLALVGSCDGRRAQATAQPPEHGSTAASPRRLAEPGATKAKGGPPPQPGAGSSADAARGSRTVALAPGTERTWRLPESPLGPMQVVIRVPKTTPPKSGFPVLIAFHGRGESLKGPARGARGWLDDYKLARAAGRLLAPPLRSTDFEGLVTKKRLEQLNSGLQRHPYRDLIVMMPFLPDRFGRGQLFANAPLMADVVVGQLLPRLRREGAGVADLSRVGIDGVSLGGRVSLVLGLTHPQVFHTVGGVQAALDETELDQLVSMAQAAHKQNPDLKLRLLTSHEDYYLDVNREFSGRLDHNGVRHRLLISSGNHSYQFNRGPGAIEMLLFHSRQL